jgi:hypothetical protein
LDDHENENLGKELPPIFWARSEGDEMTKDEIMKIASDSGIIAVHVDGDETWHGQFLALSKFAALVAEKEREACAKVCDVEILEDAYSTALINSYAEDIRARGNK